MQLVDEIVLNRGGFNLKGASFSKQSPQTALPEDSENINIAGMRWYPKKGLTELDF